MSASNEDEHRITADDIAEEVVADAMDQDPSAAAGGAAGKEGHAGPGGAGEEDDAMDEDDEDDFNPIQDTSLASFPAHAPKSVFAVALHPAYPSPPWALSGGEDDKADIWDAISGEMIAVLQGHTDSVISVGWSADGKMAASASMDGTVKVWTAAGTATQGADGVEDVNAAWTACATLEGPDEITWMAWHPKGPVLVAGAQDGTVWMWQLPAGNVMQVFSGHTSACTCGQWTPDGKRLLTASEDASLLLWDPRVATPVSKLNPHSEPRFQPYAESGGITSLAISPDNEGGKVAVVGGAGGHLRVVSLPPVSGEGGSLQVRAVLEGHQDGDSVEAIEFIDLLGATGTPANWTSVVTVSTDGRAIVWDLATNKARLSVSHPTATAIADASEGAAGAPSAAPTPASSSSKIPLAPITSLAVHKGTPMFTTAAAPDPSAIPARPALNPISENGGAQQQQPSAQHGEEDEVISPHGTLCTWDARTGALLALHTGFLDGVLDVAVGVDPDSSPDVSSPSVDAVALAMGGGSAGGARTGAGSAAQMQAIRVGGGKRWTVVGAGDEGVALVFRV
ncbi:60S ribosomal subunit assembly or modification protein [Tilletia horrida]|nr:60S ribosomal subunit assembly or modification protein [Tilletia horrida]